MKIFHNPRCSKSRATLALLRSRGLEPEVREYLLEPPTAEELSDILERLGMQPRDLIRKKKAPTRRLAWMTKTSAIRISFKP